MNWIRSLFKKKEVKTITMLELRDLFIEEKTMLRLKSDDGYIIDSEFDIQTVYFRTPEFLLSDGYVLEIDFYDKDENLFRFLIFDDKLDTILEAFDKIFRKSEIRDKKLRQLGL